MEQKSKFTILKKVARKTAKTVTKPLCLQSVKQGTSGKLAIVINIIIVIYSGSLRAGTWHPSQGNRQMPI
ncbi:hypothetical protein DGG96_19140 [Legionella qingyii]|uniref:Uncharacterized protein n=1 Tax=Legionella qingyii TaxID=2184757 RepID=A0A317TYB5_9GAMM|nr:hypothetical protein DGG96_19140 [Legionella qingyii]